MITITSSSHYATRLPCVRKIFPQSRCRGFFWMLLANIPPRKADKDETSIVLLLWEKSVAQKQLGKSRMKQNTWNNNRGACLKCSITFDYHFREKCYLSLIKKKILTPTIREMATARVSLFCYFHILKLDRKMLTLCMRPAFFCLCSFHLYW